MFDGTPAANRKLGKKQDRGEFLSYRRSRTFANARRIESRDRGVGGCLPGVQENVKLYILIVWVLARSN